MKLDEAETGVIKKLEKGPARHAALLAALGGNKLDLYQALDTLVERRLIIFDNQVRAWRLAQ